MPWIHFCDKEFSSMCTLASLFVLAIFYLKYLLNCDIFLKMKQFADLLSMCLIHYLSFPRKQKVFSIAIIIIPIKFLQYRHTKYSSFSLILTKISPGH